MSSVSGISASQSSTLTEQLTTAVTNKKTDLAKQLATTIQQTQAKSYLNNVLGSVAPTDVAGSETLQVMNQVLADAQADAVKKIDERIQQESSAMVRKDITNTPVTQVTDKTGQIVDITA